MPSKTWKDFLPLRFYFKVRMRITTSFLLFESRRRQFWNFIFVSEKRDKNLVKAQIRGKIIINPVIDCLKSENFTRWPNGQFSFSFLMILRTFLTPSFFVIKKTIFTLFKNWKFQSSIGNFEFWDFQMDSFFLASFLKQKTWKKILEFDQRNFRKEIS